MAFYLLEDTDSHRWEKSINDRQKVVLTAQIVEERKTKCCGTCHWHQHEDITDGDVCVYGQSYRCTDFTEDYECCEEWEERE